MFVYPNGLKCNVSAKRIKIFEMLNRLFVLLLLALSPLFAYWVGTQLPPDLGLGLSLMCMCVALMLPLVAGVAISFFIFEAFCKPVKPSGNRS